jgi:erythritol kinase
MASTLNIDWLLDLARGVLSDHDVAISRRDLLAGVDARVLAAEPASLIFHPFISEAGERGPFVDASARAQFFGLSLRHGYSDLMRAVFEGLAFAARDCYAAMGPIPGEIRVTGGAARSRAIRTIMGGVLGARIRTSSREEAGAAGVAMIAAVALGFYPDLAACADDWVRPLLQPALDPDPALVKRYDRLFPAYVAARQASAPVWHALQEQRRNSNA